MHRLSAPVSGLVSKYTVVQGAARAVPTLNYSRQIHKQVTCLISNMRPTWDCYSQ